MQNQRHVAGELLDSVEGFKAETLPVFGIFAVDVADTGSQHGNAEVCDHLAFLRICALACADNAVLFAADGADLCLDGQTQLVAGGNQLFGLGNVLVDGIVRAVEHDGAKAGFDALLGALIGAVVKVQRNGNGDVELFEHSGDHAYNGLVAAHIFAGALGNAENDRRVELLRGEQNGFCPLKVVDVELTYCVVACLCFGEHFFSVY